MEHGVLRLRLEVFCRRGQLTDAQGLEGPSMGAHRLLQLFFRFGESDIEDPLAVLNACQQKLQGEGGLASAGISLDEVQMAFRQSAMQDLIEARNARIQEIPAVGVRRGSRAILAGN